MPAKNSQGIFQEFSCSGKWFAAAVQQRCGGGATAVRRRTLVGGECSDVGREASDDGSRAAEETHAVEDSAENVFEYKVQKIKRAKRDRNWCIFY